MEHKSYELVDRVITKSECINEYKYTHRYCLILKDQYDKGNYTTPVELKTNHSNNPHYYHCESNTCKKYNVLIFGLNMIPHMRVLERENKNIPLISSQEGNPMSEIHKLSQNILIKYYSDGGNIQISVQCDICQEKVLQSVPSDCKILKEHRVDIDDSFFAWDIAFIKNSKVEYGIECYYSHSTIGIGLERRNQTKTPWSEHNSLDIIENITNLESITLVDIKSSKICQRCLDNKRQSLLDEKEFKRIHLKLANRLECRVDYYNCLTQKLMDEANRGKYRDKIWFNYDAKSFPETKVHSIKLEKYKRCIRCCIKDERINRNKPYCINCYRKINNEDEEDETWISIPLERKEKLRRNIGVIMNKIPVGNGCFECKITPDKCLYVPVKYYKPRTIGMETFTWWYAGPRKANSRDKNKAICTRCLDKNFIAKGILQNEKWLIKLKKKLFLL